MRNSAVRKIFEHWQMLCRNDAAPLKSELDPTKLRRQLPDLFMLGPDKDGWPQFRLAGTRICDLYDRELKGLPFETLWARGDGERILQVTYDVLRLRRPAWLDLTLQGAHGDPGCEMLLLPLRSQSDRCDRLLGAFLPNDRFVSQSGIRLPCLSIIDWAFLDRRTGFAMPRIAQNTPESVAPGLMRRLVQAFTGRVQSPQNLGSATTKS